MRVVQAVPGRPATVDLDGDALTAWLTERYTPPTGDAWVRLNLVSALGGQITGASGTSDDLADGIDRPLMGIIRGTADVVLVGAESVRANGYGIPKIPALAVATVSGDLSGNAFPDEIPPGRLFVLCPPEAVQKVTDQLGSRATVVPVGSGGAPTADALIAALHAQGLRHVLCEGGGGLVSRLVDAGLVTEFCQTIAPVLTSPGVMLTVGDVRMTGLGLTQLLVDETDRLYARWSFPER
jgi:riboflavin biosynthesis pyrimidine reductase